MLVSKRNAGRVIFPAQLNYKYAVIPAVAATFSTALKGEAEPQAESAFQPVASKFLKYEVKYAYSHIPSPWIKFQSGSHHNTKPAREKVDSVPVDMRLARPINDLLTGDINLQFGPRVHYFLCFSTYFANTS
jgi:hypothetical protein